MNTPSCAPTTFGSPLVYGTEILSIKATLVTNYSLDVLATYNFNHGATTVTDATFCNVTVTYTHPGENDTINVEAWLPPADDWNRRLQAQGGGGWVPGRFVLSYASMAGSIGEGYAAVTTDAGLPRDPLTTNPKDWALVSPGNLNLFALQNLASVSLNDMAIFAKALIHSYYGELPAYSYFNGCSQGGRQGMMLAQRYPDAFDGIAASAPAINWAEFVGASLWPGLVMWHTGDVPYACELDAITAAAIAACDPLDGVTDGLISDPDNCTFDPFSIVGQPFMCAATNGTMTISEIAAVIANETWTGARTTTGRRIWYGPNEGSDLTGNGAGAGYGVAATVCSNGTCSVDTYDLAWDWLAYWGAKNATFDISMITHEEFDTLVHQTISQFTSIIGTRDPDLTDFRNRGGKLMTFHGLVSLCSETAAAIPVLWNEGYAANKSVLQLDGTIPAKGTEDYYDRVTELLPDVHDFYRYYRAPGVGHCFGGPGGTPTTLFDALRAWVENGTVPEQLPTTFIDSSNQTNQRPLCPYPSKTTYNATCGDSTAAACYFCV